MQDLFDTYASRVYLFALRLTGNREDAEDLAQEVFVQAIRRRSQLRDPTTARTWLFAITVNLWRSRLRRKGCEEQYLRYNEQLGPRYAPLPEQEMIVQEDMRQVREAIDGLPSRQREVLYLHACEGVPLQEITEILGISLNSVKVNLSHARKRMREQLANQNDMRLPIK